MLYSQGVPLEALGVPRRRRCGRTAVAGESGSYSPSIGICFAGRRSRLWLTHTLADVFGIHERLTVDSADRIHDQIADCLARPEFRPRALFERFNIEVLTTTDAPLDPLRHRQTIRESGWNGRVTPAFRPDSVVDPEAPGFAERVAELREMTGERSDTWSGYLLRSREPARAISSRSAPPPPITDTRPPRRSTSPPPSARRSSLAP